MIFGRFSKIFIPSRKRSNHLMIFLTEVANRMLMLGRPGLQVSGLEIMCPSGTKVEAKMSKKCIF